MAKYIYNLWFAKPEGEKRIWRTFRTEEEAQAEALKHNNDEPYWSPSGDVQTNNDWFYKYWGEWWIEEKDVTGTFEVPEKIDLRAMYTPRISKTPRENGWSATHVEILKHDEVVYEYDRNYAFLDTFEPFRQDGHHYALISEKYVSTQVLDLESGKIIAEEDTKGFGFCPVDFYVPDWYDVHDESEIPGSQYWDDEDEEPSGNYGFVMGCIWGDDSSWKLQYLDLSDITKGIIRRDDRFGYVEVATKKGTRLKDHIDVWHDDSLVRIDVELTFDLLTGKINKWTLEELGKGHDQATIVVNGTSTREFGRLKEFLTHPTSMIKRVYKQVIDSVS